MRNNNLFIELPIEESEAISGGGLMTAAAYLIVAEAFGIPDDIALNTALLFLINVLTIPSELTNDFIPNYSGNAMGNRYYRSNNQGLFYPDNQSMYGAETWF